MKIVIAKRKIIIILLLPVMLLLKELLYLTPSITENLYSRLLFPPIGIVLSKFSGLLPLSLAELFVLIAFAVILFALFRFLCQLIQSKQKINILVNGAIHTLCIVSIAYSLFLLLWGFNYYRQPLAYSLNYKIEKSTIADLKMLCSNLIDTTNQLRLSVKENEAGVAIIKGGFNSAVQRSDIGYQNSAKAYPFLGGSFGKPKGILLSRQLSYTGIAGIYFPYTGEANVNMLIPDFMLPSTLCHEMAHQRGFAREDEANFIAYLACKAHKDVDFQYSGYLLATIYSMNELYKYDQDSYSELTKKYNEGVKRDLIYNSNFWKQFEGPAEELQQRINDTYLKSNKQEDGIYSYGRMVDLLLAEQKTKSTR